MNQMEYTKLNFGQRPKAVEMKKREPDPISESSLSVENLSDGEFSLPAIDE